MIVTTTDPKSYQDLTFYLDLLTSYGVTASNLVCQAYSFNSFVSRAGGSNIVWKALPGDATPQAVFVGNEINPGYMLFGNFRVSASLTTFGAVGRYSIDLMQGRDGALVDYPIIDRAYTALDDLVHFEISSQACPAMFHLVVSGAASIATFNLNFTGVLIRYF